METLKECRVPDREEFERSLVPAKRFVEILEQEADTIAKFLKGEIASDAYDLLRKKYEAEKRLIFIKTQELPAKQGYINNARQQWETNTQALVKEGKVKSIYDPKNPR